MQNPNVFTLGVVTNKHINRKGNGCLQVWIVVGQGRMVLNWDRGGFSWILGGSFSHGGWWHTGTGCPRRLWMPHPWKHSRPRWMWLWAGWSSGWWPCTQQGAETRWSLWSFSTRAILWFSLKPSLLQAKQAQNVPWYLKSNQEQNFSNTSAC